jgi:hypothetical protein
MSLTNSLQVINNYWRLSGKDVPSFSEKLHAVGCEIGTNKKLA